MRRACATPLVLLVFTSAIGAGERELISFRTIQVTGDFFAEGAAAGDVDGDGHLDIVSGPFWYKGPDFTTRHAYCEPKAFDPLGYSDNFFAFTEDLNGNGWTDILIIGFPGQAAVWYENPQGREGFWQRHAALERVDNESPTFVDLTGDGRREIVCSVAGFFGFAAPGEDPTRPWTFRPISDESAGGPFTHGLGVGDVNGNGRLDLLEKSGWWEQPASLEGDPVWKKHPFPFSEAGGAQMYAFDFDGDGRNDVLTSLAAHGYGLAWYQNVLKDGRITFRRHTILGDAPEENRYGVNFSQLHAVALADIDGDGLPDIVTGKRWWAHGPRGDAEPNAPAVLYWFRTVRTGDGAGPESVDFVPHLVSEDSGVGVEVKALDVNGDGLLDIVVGSKKGAFVHIQERRAVSEDEWHRHQPVAREDRAQPSRSGLPPQEGLTPEEAVRAMTVPRGFRAELVAGEPVVHQPVAFTIDERGRLWIAEAHTYPQRAPEGEGKDRILILEDSNGDGTFDTSKTFIEGLNLVSGLEVGFGGVWVGAAPYLLFIPDRDGDDVPDGEAQVLLDGWGYQDTHETLNSFLWGPDGWLYGCQGVFTHSNVGRPGTPDKERTPLNAGVWRYHPTRHEFEVFAWGTSNPWGIDFDDHGQAFITTCVIPHLFHAIQGGRYHRQAGQHFSPYVYDDLKTIADHAHYAGNVADHAWWGRDEPVADDHTHHAGGGHAHCGAMVYLGDNWPVEYRNTIFMANIHGNRINNDGLRREGSGFVGTHRPDFLFANDRWFRGISLRYGPDGGVFLIDWYDKNACHRGHADIWDRSNGRVYKVTYGDAPPAAQAASGAEPRDLAAAELATQALELSPANLDLAKLSDRQLVRLHLHENDWYVRTARRILQERAAAEPLAGAAHDALRAMLDDHPDPTRRLRALWTLHATGGLDESSLRAGLDDRNEYLRAWSVQLLHESTVAAGGSAFVPLDRGTVERLAAMSRSDRSPAVRLYLAAALQRMPLDDRWEIARGLLGHAGDAGDHNLPLMTWYGVEPLVMHDVPRAMALAAESRIPQVTRFIVRRAASDANGIDHVLEALGTTPDEPAQLLVLDEIVNVVRNRARLAMPESWPEIYRRLAQSENAEIRERVQFITVKFGDTSIFPALRTIVADQQADLEARRQALAALVSAEDRELAGVLRGLLEDEALRAPALRALARYDEPWIPEAILDQYPRLTGAEKEDAVGTLAARPHSARALLEAIERGDVPRTDLPAFTAGQMQRFGDEALLDLLNRVWGQIRSTPEEKRELIAEFQRRLTPEALAEADLSNGRLVFEKTCAKCHRLFGEGGEIGPDITGSNRADLDYILENILDPSAVVGRDYQMTVIVTEDGRVVSGLVKEENETAIVLQTVNEEVVVPREDVDERVTSSQSLMPDGQLEQLTSEEARDLIAYLASPAQVPLPGQTPPVNPRTGRAPGAIEGEAMKVVAKTAGDARSQKMDAFTRGEWRWSGTDQLWWTGAGPNDALTLEFPVSRAGRYEVFAVMTKARDYAVVELAIDDRPAGPAVDLYHAPDVITTGPVSLGTHDLEPGNHRLTVRIAGANPQALKAYMFGLDYLYLAPARSAPNGE